MKGHPTTFWAKLRRDPAAENAEWHSVEHHCGDVAACFEMLLNQPVIAVRLARLAGLSKLDAIQRSRLCVFAALHDLGKCNSGFQRRRDLPRGDPRTAGHTAEVCALLDVQNEDSDRLGAALGVERLISWFESDDAFYELFLATLSHHGRPLAVSPARAGIDPLERCPHLCTPWASAYGIKRRRSARNFRMKMYSPSAARTSALRDAPSAFVRRSSSFLSGLPAE